MKKFRTCAAIGAVLALLTAPAASALPVAGGPQDQPLRSDDLSAPHDPFVVPAAQPVLPPTATVTLLTGERVRLDADPGGAQSVTALPPLDSTDVPSGPAPLYRFTWNGDAYVVPAEAVPFLSSTLDLRLFDVSYLVRAGLDDKHGTALPVTIKASTDGTAQVPGVSATLAAGTTTTTTMDRSQATGFGTQLQEQWRASRTGTSDAPLGTLPGISRIDLAARPGAPALPVSPARATPGKVSPSLVAGGSSTPSHFRTLSVNLINLLGTSGVGIGIVHNVDDGRLGTLFINYPGQPGPFNLSVPGGTYSIEVTIFNQQISNLNEDAAFVVKPQVDVNSDTTITLDARDAKPYHVSLDQPVNAPYQQDILTFTRMAATNGGFRLDGYGFGGLSYILGLRLFRIPGFPTLYATPTAPVTKGSFGFLAFTQWTPSLDQPSNDPRYRLAFPHEGTIPSSLDYHVAVADLTTEHEHVYQPPTGATPESMALRPYLFLPWSMDSLGVDPDVLPGDRVDYFYSDAPDITQWQDLFVDGYMLHYGPRRTLKPGQQVDVTWGKGPLAPPPAAPYAQIALGSGSAFGLDLGDGTVDSALLRTCPACRQDDNAMLYLASYGDSDPTHYMNGADVQSSRIQFFADGALKLTSDANHALLTTTGLPLPMLHKAADYRLEWAYTSPADPAGRISTAWSFRSDPGDAGTAPPSDEQCPPDPSRTCSMLPLLFVNYDLALDHQSRAAAGAPFQLGFTVSAQRGAPAPAGLAATVSVSYDDGKTWSAEQAAQAGADGTFSTTIDHPELAATSGFVSLRVRAHDSAGDAVDQTIIHAYGLTG